MLLSGSLFFTGSFSTLRDNSVGTYWATSSASWSGLTYPIGDDGLHLMVSDPNGAPTISLPLNTVFMSVDVQSDQTVYNFEYNLSPENSKILITDDVGTTLRRKNFTYKGMSLHLVSFQIIHDNPELPTVIGRPVIGCIEGSTIRVQMNMVSNASVTNYVSPPSFEVGKNNIEKTKQELEKAKIFLKDTIGEKDYEKYIAGQYVVIKTDKCNFGFDRNKNIYKQSATKIFESQKTYGRLWSNSLCPDDLVASFYVWAKNTPDDLLRRWGCGNITINDHTRKEE